MSHLSLAYTRHIYGKPNKQTQGVARASDKYDTRKPRRPTPAQPKGTDTMPLALRYLLAALADLFRPPILAEPMPDDVPEAEENSDKAQRYQ